MAANPLGLSGIPPSGIAARVQYVDTALGAAPGLARDFSPGSSHNRTFQALLAISDAPLACFALRAQQAPVPLTLPHFAPV